MSEPTQDRNSTAGLIEDLREMKATAIEGTNLVHKAMGMIPSLILRLDALTVALDGDTEKSESDDLDGVLARLERVEARMLPPE